MPLKFIFQRLIHLQHHYTYLLEEENTHSYSKSGSHVVCRTAQLKYLFTLFEIMMLTLELRFDLVMSDHFELVTLS